ncbi:MAG: hypothetical protein FWD28_00880 [Treponema sp.]|nr:hypothetical protein [Treponema sp.]
MILTEWNTEDAIAFARQEEREEAYKLKDNETAKRLLAEGSTLEFTQKITGLDLETIRELSSAS